jgi:hypothetical protein
VHGLEQAGSARAAAVAQGAHLIDHDARTEFGRTERMGTSETSARACNDRNAPVDSDYHDRSPLS